jgi:hypothetical protein
VRLPPEQSRDQRDHHDLQRLDQQQRADLAQQQSRPGQRRGPEPLDHSVAPLEPGCDRERRERRGHHGQRQHARCEHVDGTTGELEPQVCRALHPADQDDDRDHHGEEELLPVAEHQP